jgi:hypothetical protein
MHGRYRSSCAACASVDAIEGERLNGGEPGRRECADDDDAPPPYPPSRASAP